ncbi:TetR family transcriptional regulator [Arthrobacter sp. MYb23]|uniref:TetR/AcrR family transcriptional regulator n=1 Tax=unclassified Arthrobacter TaxID=235627 RepID=UPI000CFE2940|nr:MULTISPECIES: TetR/AcrR family transcriptional regulator [unclassified Arthrobacter]PRB42121.1 TetR family transcriptional regulator [Arthrobacter sp. MYb51]PRB95178.1 TetR family transcriptional regulator [Arthrobacter sp. MYb23]
MPKIVDHDQRRLELVDATWRIIARLGMEGATMREIAEEAGFANGALKPYFPTKDLLLTSAFGHVFNRTNQRIATMTEGLSGIAALRAFCAEVLPLDEERVNEARIVIPFWQKALNDAHMAALHSKSMRQWHSTLATHCAAARAAGEIKAPIGDAAVADHLLNMMLGAQIVVALSPAEHFSQDLAGQLDHYLALLAG